VPTQPATAPSASTAARPRPSAMPPAASTGSGSTASTTAGTRGSVATAPCTWPPASHPCATTVSTPASAARRASTDDATMCTCAAPAACTAPTYGAGSPHDVDTTRTPSSRHARIRPCWDHFSTKFTWWGPLEFTIPATRPRQIWQREIDTFEPLATQPPGNPGAGDVVAVGPRSVLLLRASATR